MPTICRKTGSFSPHLTLSAVGCALSHRKAWERLAASKKHEWALILEDDAVLKTGFHAKLFAALALLPSNWTFLFLGCALRPDALPYPPAMPPEALPDQHGPAIHPALHTRTAHIPSTTARFSPIATHYGGY